MTIQPPPPRLCHSRAYWHTYLPRVAGLRRHKLSQDLEARTLYCAWGRGGQP